MEEEEEAAAAFLMLQIKEGKNVRQLFSSYYVLHIYRSTILFLLFDNIKKSLGSKVQLLRDQQRRM